MWSEQLKTFFTVYVDGDVVTLRCKACQRELIFTHHAPLDVVEVEGSIHALYLCPNAQSTWRLLRQEGRI